MVIALTGLYTALGGMRAVAYNDAVQVLVLIVGSALLTFYGLIKLGGWHELRVLCGSDMFNLWKPIIAPGTKEPGRRFWKKLLPQVMISQGRPGISIKTFRGRACSFARR